MANQISAEPQRTGPRRIQYGLRTLVGLLAIVCGLCALGVRAGWGASLFVVIAIAAFGSIWISRNKQLVRLLAAVVACWFVVRYDYLARARFGFDHPGERLTEARITEFIALYAAHAYAVPVAALVVGVLILYFRPNSPVLIELIVSSLWVLAFTWVVVVVLVWQMQNVPMITGGKWHY